MDGLHERIARTLHIFALLCIHLVTALNISHRQANIKFEGTTKVERSAAMRMLRTVALPLHQHKQRREEEKEEDLDYFFIIISIIVGL